MVCLRILNILACARQQDLVVYPSYISHLAQRCFFKIQWFTILAINSFTTMPDIVPDTRYTTVNKTKNSFGGTTDN